MTCQALLTMNFNLAVKCCDSEELENGPWKLLAQYKRTRYNKIQFVEFFSISKAHLLRDINFDEIDKPDETFDEYEFNQSSSSDNQRKTRH